MEAFFIKFYWKNLQLNKNYDRITYRYEQEKNMKFKLFKKTSKPRNFMGRVPEVIIFASIVADIASPFFLLPSPPLNEAPERMAKIKLKKYAARSVYLEGEEILVNREKELPSFKCDFYSFSNLHLDTGKTEIVLAEEDDSSFLPASSNEIRNPNLQKVSNWYRDDLMGNALSTLIARESRVD